MSVTINITKLHLAIAVVAVALIAPTTAAVAFHVFDDVSDDRFFSEAVEWAAANGITTGTSATTFEPDANVTRGQNVTFAKRYDDNIVQPALAALAADIAALQAAQPFAVTSRDDRSGASATAVVIVSVEVTAPVAGQVTVNSTTSTQAGSAGDLVICSITTNTFTDNEYLQRWDSAGTDGRFSQVAGTRVFDIATGETVTYNLVCAQIGGSGNLELFDSVLSAIFTPAP